jgi:hypothetical protein
MAAVPSRRTANVVVEPYRGLVVARLRHQGGGTGALVDHQALWDEAGRAAVAHSLAWRKGLTCSNRFGSFGILLSPALTTSLLEQSECTTLRRSFVRSTHAIVIRSTNVAPGPADTTSGHHHAVIPSHIWTPEGMEMQENPATLVCARLTEPP